MIKDNKKIIFFDGDGTIWYPKKTKRKVSPHWIYSNKKTKKDCLRQLELVPGVIKILKKIKQNNIALILLSTHPTDLKNAQQLLKEKIEYFNLQNLFNECFATQGHHESKGEFILKILKNKKIPKSKALMIGDSYHYDYLSAKKINVDSLLIKTPYTKKPIRGKIIKNMISKEDMIVLKVFRTLGIRPVLE